MVWEGSERRNFIRAVFPCKILVGSPVRLFASHTEDIGEGGIRVLLEERLNLLFILLIIFLLANMFVFFAFLMLFIKISFFILGLFF